MKKVSVQSPTRVDLAGGTLDLWPLYLFLEEAYTVNVAISIYTQAEIEEVRGEEIELISTDLGLAVKFKNLQECLEQKDPKLALLNTQLQYWRPKKGFRLKTSSQSPVGGGLGGSSSLTISLMKAFEQFCGVAPKSVHQIVDVSHHIEAKVLHTPTGTQDYYPAFSGGLNILKYDCDGIAQTVLPIVGTPLDTHFLLAYTGKSHHSGLNNFEVLKGAIGKDSRTLSSLQALSKISFDMKKKLTRGDWTEIGSLFREEYKYRVQLAPAFTSPEIEELSKLSLREGAEAVKICGAGGGGCVLIWVPPAQRQKVSSACQKAGYQILDAKPVQPL